MATSGKLIDVTPEELDAALDKILAENITELAIAGDLDWLSADSMDWPDELRGKNVYRIWKPLGSLAVQIARLSQLTKLVLWDVGLNAAGVRAIAEHLPELTYLDVWDNEIGDAGARAIAEHLPLLMSLNVGGNEIGEEGARAIATHLPQLISLNMGGNKVGEAGARSIGEYLQQLTRLLLWGNNIGEVGAQAIAINLRKLEQLWLQDNSIGNAAITAIGQNLQALSLLSVANNNQISDITPLAQLPALTSLNLSRTSVSDLSPFANRVLPGWPVRWKQESGEYGISVKDCPLVRPSVEIASQGPEAVLNYFREIAAQGVDRLYEAKVLLLGEGGAGKTSLLRRLYQADLPLPEEDQTTRGIDIHRQDFVADNGQSFRLNVWDFGGQQIYHATHQFFLTKSSLYILVDDTKKDDKSIHDEAFKFWLEVVEVLSDSSPLLIFQNEKGGRSKAIDEAGIKGRFPNFKETYRGNLEQADCVAKIRQAIEYFVQQLPHIGDEVPAKWVSIRQTLEDESRDKPFITQDEYFAIYGRHLEFDRTKALHLSRYLHDLGVFLHFQDDLLLRKTVILQNQWATEAVFRILDDEIVKQQRGQFNRADCERLWAESQYADMHGELLGLMVKFELCYLLVDTHELIWLAPQLLSPSKPTQLSDWASPSDLVVSYRYSFLPRGLVSRLMVRKHRFAKRLDLAWAHGAVFEHDDTEVLVEETAQGNEIEFRARGPERKALLSVLASDLGALNDSFKGLKGKVETWVPCICEQCRQETAPEMYRQSELVRRKRDNKATIECRQSYADVNVLELLDGLKPERLPDWAAQAGRDEVLDEILEGTRSAVRQRRSRTVKIFLASSAELQADRDEFELYFRQQNDRLRNDGLYLEIVRWENFLDAMSESRLQDEYNKAVRDCDIFVGLFVTKTGKYTEEEFDVAREAFDNTGRPLIYTFFREFNLSSNDINLDDLSSLDAFKKKLDELGHYYTTYRDAEHLKRQFLDQLHKLEL